jgi:hypothetical protein
MLGLSLLLESLMILTPNPTEGQEKLAFLVIILMLVLMGAGFILRSIGLCMQLVASTRLMCGRKHAITALSLQGAMLLFGGGFCIGSISSGDQQNSDLPLVVAFGKDVLDIAEGVFEILLFAGVCTMLRHRQMSTSLLRYAIISSSCRGAAVLLMVALLPALFLSDSLAVPHIRSHTIQTSYLLGGVLAKAAVSGMLFWYIVLFLRLRSRLGELIATS